jgi:hypothetical protein
MLFLSRGSAPLMMNKLDYSAASVVGAAPKADDPPHWNQRPRDAANIARWVGRQIERDLNWQIVNLLASVDDLHDAPILYLAGNQAIELTSEQQEKLRQFVEEGGIILGNADAVSSNFAGAFQKLGKSMFPAYDFAPLPENHVIYTNQQFKRSQWKRKPTLLAMGNGARVFMLLLPDSDPARSWQMQAAAGREELFQLADDVFLYAVDKQNLRRRGESYIIRPNDKIVPTKSIALARIQCGGNWDPEPGGWRRVAAMLRNTSKIDLKVEAVNPEQLAGRSIAHLTGTSAVSFDPAARAAIKQFVEKGGTLIIDAAGGSTEFAKSVEAELAAIFPEQKDQLNQPLAPDHAIYGKLKSFGYRPYARTKLGTLKGPQVRGIEIGGRIAVIYSREDLSVGLVGQPVDGIVGYDPETATAMMTRAILYATKN